MKGKALTTRRQKNRELAALEFSRRCAQCKRPLAEVTAVYEDLASWQVLLPRVHGRRAGGLHGHRAGVMLRSLHPEPRKCSFF